MVITIATLFKTPFTNDYKNVIDDYTSEADYFAFLSANYTNYEIEGTKSVFADNTGFAVITPISYMIAKEYNYIRITDGNTAKYAFITNVNTINDNITNPTCKLICDFDAWSNNYLSFKNDQILKNTFIKTRTYQSMYSKSVNTFVPLGLSSEKEVKLHKTVIPHQQSTNGFIDGFHLGRVLWLVVRVDPSCSSERYTSNATFEAKIPAVITSLVQTQNNAPIFYIPYCVIDETNQSLTGKVTTISSSLDFNVSISLVDFFNSSLNSAYIYSISITSVPPFDYSITEIDPINRLFEVTAVSNIVKITNSDNANVLIACYGQGFNYKTWKFNVPLKTFSNIDLNINSCVTDYCSKFESALYTYPYNYDSILIDNREIPLIPQIGLSTDFIIEYSSVNLTGAQYRFYQEGQEVPKWTYIENNNSFVFSTSSLSSFMASNSAQISTARGFSALNGAVSMGSSLFSGNALGFFSGGGNIINTYATTEAKKIDAANAPDSIEIGAIIGTNKPLYLDYPVIIHHEIESAFDLDYLYVLFHNYGYEFNRIGDPIKPYHYSFDYVKTSNFDIPFILNYADYNKIKNAFDIGVTMWHITDPNNSPLFNKCMLNPSLNFIP